MSDQPRRRMRAEASLETRFEAWRQLPARGARPHRGWIRAIREALGMTAGELAERMGVTQPSVTRLERSERESVARLDTLVRAADALECDFVYALVPRRPLGEMVTDQARQRARERVEEVAHTMALENQAVSPDELAEQLVLLTDQYRYRPGLWSSDGDDPPARTARST